MLLQIDRIEEEDRVGLGVKLRARRTYCNSLVAIICAHVLRTREAVVIEESSAAFIRIVEARHLVQIGIAQDKRVAGKAYHARRTELIRQDPCSRVGKQRGKRSDNRRRRTGYRYRSYGCGIE